MPKSLVIAEKPSVAHDLAKALGGFTDQDKYLESETYIISWAVGHLVEFIPPEEINPKYKAWLLEDLPILPEHFSLKAKDKCKEQLSVLRKLAKREDVVQLVNACDAGREGELIFREIVEFLKIKKPSLRLWLQSMTPEAIRTSFRTMKSSSEYDGLSDAAKCRSEADWLIGINATRGLTRRLKARQEKTSWSAGRVQTPTLAMVAAREMEILAFRPTPFWRLTGIFEAPTDSAVPHTYEGTWINPKFKSDPDRPEKDDWITTKEQLDAIMQAVNGQAGLARETCKPANEFPPPLLDLGALQKEANKRFGMSAKSTLAVAQKLYESHKLITYPRTKAKCLPTDNRATVMGLLRNLGQNGNRVAHEQLDYRSYAESAAFLLNNGLRNNARNFNDNGDYDHYAIIPTGQHPARALRDDEAKIYNLIIRRFLAAFFPPAEYTKIERFTEINQQTFRTSAKVLRVPGYLSVYGRTVEQSKKLPMLRPASDSEQPAQNSSRVPARNISLASKDEESKPPSRITDSRLLTLMETAGDHLDDEAISQILDEKGLGTPATRADIIETLIMREYMARIDRAFKATAKGIKLIDMLNRIEAKQLTSPKLTAEMESHLEEVEHGKRSRKAYMDEIQEYVMSLVEKTKTFDYTEIYENDPPLGRCPMCGTRMVREHMRFYSCEGNTGSDNSACKFIIWKDKSGRYLDRKTVTELLENSVTSVLEGFGVGSKFSYKARLRLTCDNSEILIEGTDVPEEELATNVSVSPDPVGVCPFDSECSIRESSSHYACEHKCVEKGLHKTGFTLPRVVCKRPISHEELAKYLADGKTDLLENFTSRLGRPFKGYLVLKPTGKHGFEFEPRAPKAGSKAKTSAASSEVEAKPATRKRTTTKAATTKTTTTRKRATAAEGETATKTTTTRKRATTATKSVASAEGETATKTTTTRKRATAATKSAASAEGETATKTTTTRKRATAATKSAVSAEGETATKTTTTRKRATAATKSAANAEGETATKTTTTTRKRATAATKSAASAEGETATKTTATRKRATAATAAGQASTTRSRTAVKEPVND